MKDRDRHMCGSLHCSITNSCWKHASSCLITRSSSLHREMFGLHARHFFFLPLFFLPDPNDNAGRVQDLHNRQGARLPNQTCNNFLLACSLNSDGEFSVLVFTGSELGAGPETREDRQAALGRAAFRGSDGQGPPHVLSTGRGD